MYVETAQAAFRGTGIFPLDKSAIPAAAFAPSLTSERSEIPSISPEQRSASALTTPPAIDCSTVLDSTVSASAADHCEYFFTVY